MRTAELVTVGDLIDAAGGVAPALAGEVARSLVLLAPSAAAVRPPLVRCCPSCRRPARDLVTGLELHHAEDGTQCPAVWPAYVVGAPVPGRRARVTHSIPRRTK